MNYPVVGTMTEKPDIVEEHLECSTTDIIEANPVKVNSKTNKSCKDWQHEWKSHWTLIDDGDGEFEFLELICTKCSITRPWLSSIDSNSEEAEECDANRKDGPDEADDWDSRGEA
tara:strand:+ start:89 stop:433 length:345 start_codon:yes stop_codon:yes gene_type:complete